MLCRIINQLFSFRLNTILSFCLFTIAIVFTSIIQPHTSYAITAGTSCSRTAQDRSSQRSAFFSADNVAMHDIQGSGRCTTSDNVLHSLQTADGSHPIVLLLNSNNGGNIFNVNNFRINHAVSGLTMNGNAVSNGTRINVTSTTDFTFQYTRGGKLLTFTTTVDPNANTMTGFTITEIIPPDTTPPTLTSVIRNNPTAENINANFVTWLVTFSEDMQTPALNSFIFTGRAKIESVVENTATAAKNDFLVTANVNGLRGNLELSFDSTKLPSDVAGNVMTNPIATNVNQPYNTDRLPPQVASIVRQGHSSPVSGPSSLTWRVTFSEDITGGTASSFSAATTGTGTVSVSNVVAVETDAYDVTVTGANLANEDQTVTLSLVATNNIMDPHGNKLVNAATPTGTNEAATIVTKPITVPDAPTNLRTTSLSFNPNRWNVAWDTPANDGGSRITGYDWRFFAGADCSGFQQAASQNISGTSLSRTNTLGQFLGRGVTSGGMRVQAINAIGKSELSACVPVVFDNVKPEINEVTQSFLSPTTRTSLRWSITFTEEVQNVDASDFVISGTTADLSVTGSGISYTIDAAGGDLASVAGNVTLGFNSSQNIEDLAGNKLTNLSPRLNSGFTYTVQRIPDAPTGTNASTATTTAITMRWTAPADNGSPITLYSANVYENATCIGVPISSNSRSDGGTAFALGNRLPDTEYSFMVTAENAVGQSVPSICQPIRTQAVQDQTITFDQPSDVIFGDQASLTASSSSSLNVEFSTTSASSVCTIAGTTLTATGVGECVINANQAGNTGFHPAPEISRTINITRRPVTITADEQSKIYGESLALDNKAFKVADKGVVSDTILPFGNRIDTALMLSAQDAASSMSQDASTFTDNISLAFASSNGSGGFDVDNYNITTVNGDLIVNKRSITVTANKQQKEFGQVYTLDNTAFTVQDLDGDAQLPNGEQINTVKMFSELNVAGSTTAGVALFRDNIKISSIASVPGGFNASNYQVSFVDGDLEVVDTTGPVVTSLGFPSSGVFGVGALLDYTVNFNEPVSVAGTPIISQSVGGTRRDAQYLSGSGSSALVFRYTVQAGDNDNNGIVIGALLANGGSLKDAQGNDANLNLNKPGFAEKVIVDTTSPTVAITTNTDGTFSQANPGTFTATVTFSEGVSGVELTDLVVGNGMATLSSGADGDAIYTFIVTPNNQGNVTLNIAAGVASDEGNNGNAIATEVAVTRTDDVAPVISGTSSLTTTLSSGGRVTLAATVADNNGGFIEPSFFIGDQQIDTNFVFPVGVTTVTVIAEDSAGNKAKSVKFTVTVTDDIVPYIVSIERQTPATTDQDELSWIVTFSEPVNGFDASDLNITGVTGNPTVKVTPITRARQGNLRLDELFKMFSLVSTAHAQGATMNTLFQVTVSGGNIANGNTVVGLQASQTFGVQDAGNNTGNNAQPTAVNQAQITVINDTDAPSVAILNAPEKHDRSTPFNITVQFSEDVTDFVIGDITVANANLSSFVAVSGSTYTVDVTPTGPLDITIDVAANVAQDAAQNGNTAAPQVLVKSTIVEETLRVIADFMQNRANHIISNQPDLTGFITGSNTQGGGSVGTLALNATTGSQVLAFSTSRSKILAEMQKNHAATFGAGGPLAQTSASTNAITQGNSLFESSYVEQQQTSEPKQTSQLSYGLGGDDALTVQSGADLIAEQRQTANVVGDDTANVDADAVIANRAGTWDIWTEVYGSNSNAGNSDSRLWVAYIGSHYFIDDFTLVGLLGQVDWADETNAVQGSRANGTGWMIGPYIAGQLPGQNLFYEARASWGQSDNDVSPIGTFTNSFDTTRYLLSGKVSGNFKHNAYTIKPSVSVSYFEETQDSYTDSLSNIIPEQTISLGEMRFGPEISQDMLLDDGTLFTPKLGVAGVFNFNVKNDNASQGAPLGDDDFRARIDAGFSATNPENGYILSAEGFYDGIGIDDFDSYGGRVRVTVPLN